ncbi:glycosyltransferase family 1 protein [Flaviflexus huanghaiensis]|uniref:glycosyltransferase family 1 protein n=1 Tax=Flaviflexus huanghaiensis TaxID=1111473 RepID=UPI0015FE262E|nr:glycosyltransferase family 1 protein [Flaviflexus huanghaiensis]
MRPTLLILSFSPIAADARVLKQVRLFADVYDVTTCGYGPMPEGVVEHIRIPDELIYWRKDRKLLITKQYRAVLEKQEVNAYLRTILANRTFDVILADDIDPVPLALELAPRGGVHADLHEYSPGQKQDDWKWRAFVGPYISWLVSTFVTRADRVTTVCDGIADEYRRRFGIEASVVMNATPLHDLAPRPTGEPILLVHSGACLRNRNLQVMIEAMNEVQPGRFILDFYLTPNDPGYLDELKEQAARTPGVTIHEPVEYDRLVARLNEYDLGVFLLPPVNFNYRFALPNKFFDFIQARLGIIIGPSPEMEKILNRENLGAVSADFTASALAETLNSVTRADIERWKMNSHESAGALSAEQQSQGWIESVAALAARAIAKD